MGSPLVLTAVATVAGHLLVLILWGQKPPGPLFSDALQTLSAALAAAACFRAGARSNPAARSFWQFSGAGFFLWAVAHLFWIYYLYFIPVPNPSAGPSVILHFFAFTPFFMALFLSPDTEDHEQRWESYLDLLQILIVVSTLYLFFLYTPTWHLTEQDWMARRVRTVNLRNLILSSAFVVRALATRSRSRREPFNRVGAVVVLYSLGSAVGNQAFFVWSIPVGNWFDLGWTVPFLLMVPLAEKWRPGPEADEREAFGYLHIVLSFLLTLSLPLVVAWIRFVRGPLTGSEAFLISGAVAGVTVCFFARLLLTQRRQQRTFHLLRSSVNEQRLLEAQLRQAQKMDAVGRLAGGVAHDFNNLLTVITGYSDFLIHAIRPDDPLREDAVQIQAAANRAAALTRQLLAFSRQQVLEPRVVNLATSVENLGTMLRRLIGEDIEIATHLAPDLGSVRVDPGQIDQIIMNLAVNARDAMPSGGKLTLETVNMELDEAYTREHAGVRPGRYVMLAVTDNGTGMDAETKAHIFEPFYTTKAQGKGTGLGLAMVYGVVRQSEGHIWVYSEPGHGTSIKIYLPRVDQPADAAVRERRSASVLRGTETILLVEDDAALRGLANAILRASGYSVLTAGHVSEVDQLCRQQDQKIHLLLTDVVMPGVGGWELGQRVRQLLPDVKVLYMSGYTDRAVVGHGALEAGDSFLQKPFTPVALAEKVREVLDQPAPRGGS